MAKKANRKRRLSANTSVIVGTSTTKRRRVESVSVKSVAAPVTSKRGDRREHWYCYTLASHNCARTYVGKTNCLQRRIRQHNGEIKGGAKATRGRGPWFFAYYVKGLRSETHALQLEWRLHNPPGGRKKYKGVIGRVRALIATTNMERWTRSAPLACNVPLTVVWRPEFAEVLAKVRHRFPSHVRHEIASLHTEGLQHQ